MGLAVALATWYNEIVEPYLSLERARIKERGTVDMCVIKDFEIGKKSGAKKKKQFNETKKQPEQLSADMDIETKES